MCPHSTEMDDVPMTIGEALSRIETASWDELCSFLRDRNPLISEAADQEMRERAKRI